MSGPPDRERRTIDPTPNRIEQFRKRGEVARSMDLSASATSFVGAIVAITMFTSSRELLIEFARNIFGALDRKIELDLATQGVTVFLGACLPAAGGALAGYLVSTALQVGAPPSFGKLEFKPERVFSFGGLKQLFDARESAWRVIKSVLKLTVVGIAAWIALSSEFDTINASMNLSADGLSEMLGRSIRKLISYAGVALLFLGVADFVVSKRRLMEKMRMTPEEMKREMKEQEGNPEIKRARRMRMRELARRRVAVEVPKADVVILNPTHYAIAIRYRAEEGGAPRVVAKGKDAMAAKIRELAKQHGVPMLRKPSLARLLFKTVREGGEVPPKLYRAVAEVLAYIYRVQRVRKPQ